MLAAAASEPSSTADAPSFSGEALPGVIVPSLRKEGLSPLSFSADRAGADALVARELDAGDGHDQVGVEAGLPGRVGEVVRTSRELVLALP